MRGRLDRNSEAFRAAVRSLKTLPGVGSSVAEDLIRLGFRSAEELKGQDPEALFRRLEELEGRPVDRCMLYVLRCAVYAVTDPDPRPDRLLWWAWKDPPA
jgi:hypothetical protein